MVVLGIDIGGTMIKTALISQNEVSFKKRFPTPSDKEQFQRLLSQMIRDYQEIQSFHKIAFSVSGSVDQSGTVRFGCSLSGSTPIAIVFRVGEFRSVR